MYFDIGNNNFLFPSSSNIPTQSLYPLEVDEPKLFMII